MSKLYVTDLRRPRGTTLVVNPKTGAISVRRPTPGFDDLRTTSLIAGWRLRRRLVRRERP